MFLFSLCIAAISTHAFAANEAEKTSKSSEEAVTEMKAQKRSILKTEENGKGLTIGGYGEAVYSHNFYSDKYIRYTAKDPSVYKGQSHGRFDLPHVVLFLNYNFGHGWSMGSEIEFEHGGTESAIEIEEEEAGEYESEIERGGEVALEQFWIQKSICPEFNIKLGHIIVPVGGTNQNRRSPGIMSPGINSNNTYIIPGFSPDSCQPARHRIPDLPGPGNSNPYRSNSFG